MLVNSPGIMQPEAMRTLSAKSIEEDDLPDFFNLTNALDSDHLYDLPPFTIPGPKLHKLLPGDKQLICELRKTWLGTLSIDNIRVFVAVLVQSAIRKVDQQEKAGPSEIEPTFGTPKDQTSNPPPKPSTTDPDRKPCFTAHQNICLSHISHRKSNLERTEIYGRIDMALSHDLPGLRRGTGPILFIVVLRAVGSFYAITWCELAVYMAIKERNNSRPGRRRSSCLGLILMDARLGFCALMRGESWRFRD